MLTVAIKVVERNAFVGDRIVVKKFDDVCGFALEDEPHVRVIVPLGTRVIMSTPLFKTNGACYFTNLREIVAEVGVLSLFFKSEHTVLPLKDVRQGSKGEILQLGHRHTPARTDEALY